MNLNKIFACGRITKDPVLKSTPNGQSVTSFSIAVNRNWSDKSGAKKEAVEFINCVSWGKTAELITQYMKKGNELLVEGRLQTRSWADKSGNKRSTTEIVVESMQFGARPQGQRAEATHVDTDSPELGTDIPTVEPDVEIPF